MEERLARKLNYSLILAIFGNLLVIIITVGGTYFISSLASQIRADNTRANVVLTRPAKLKQLREDYSAIKPDIPLINDALPENDFKKLLPVTNELSKLAKRLKLFDSTVISDTQLVAANGNPYLAVNIGFRSTLPQMQQYLIGLEKLSFFIEVENLAITDSININGQSNVKIVARLYVRKTAP